MGNRDSLTREALHGLPHNVFNALQANPRSWSMSLGVHCFALFFSCGCYILLRNILLLNPRHGFKKFLHAQMSLNLVKKGYINKI